MNLLQRLEHIHRELTQLLIDLENETCETMHGVEVERDKSIRPD